MVNSLVRHTRKWERREINKNSHHIANQNFMSFCNFMFYTVSRYSLETGNGKEKGKCISNSQGCLWQILSDQQASQQKHQ